MRWRIAVASALLAPKSKVTQSATAQTAACLRHRYVHADRTGSRSSAPGYATRPTHTVTDARQPVVTMRVARASAWSQTLRNPLKLRPTRRSDRRRHPTRSISWRSFAATLADARITALRDTRSATAAKEARRSAGRCQSRCRRLATRSPSPPSSSAGLTSTRRATRMNPRRVADSSVHPTTSPGRGSSVALSVRSSELCTSRRSLAWRTSSPTPYETSSAASDLRPARFSLRIIRAMQLPGARGKIAEGVALRKRARRRL